MQFFKNYVKTFLIFYILLVATKLLFSFYLGFDEVFAVFWGYKFDFAVSAIAAFFSVVFSFNSKIAKTVFFIFFLWIAFAQVGDIIYFSESGRHIGYEVKDFFIDFLPLLNTAFSKYTFLSLSAIFGISLIVFFLFRIKIYERFSKWYILKVVIALVLSIFFIRGEFQHIPLHPYQASAIGDNKKAAVALNGVYNMLYAFAHASKAPKMISIPKPTQQVIEQSFQVLYPEKNTTTPLMLPQRPNVVLFFLESWSAKYLRPYGFEKETTPNFDHYYQKGIKPLYMMANGHRTTEGIFATLTSYPNPLGKTVAKTPLQDFKYDSMIEVFNQAGYWSGFFQGTSKDTSGTGSLAQYLGFKESYGKRDIQKRLYEENYWGVQDVDLYNFVLTKLPRKKPFIIGINGATTHDHIVPKGFKTKHFSDDKRLNEDLNALYFADMALGEFIKKIEKQYPNTLFVLFADHCGGHIQDMYENYKIPFVLYAPFLKAKKYDVILSQLDISPTVIDMIFGDYKKILPNATGKSLLSDKKFFAPFFHNGVLGWIEDKNFITYTIGNKTFSCGKECKKYDKHLLSFTYITQKLLFEGKTQEFYKYRKNSK